MELDFGLILLVSEVEVMIKRDNWEHPDFVVRGEILGFMRNEQLQKNC